MRPPLSFHLVVYSISLFFFLHAELETLEQTIRDRETENRKLKEDKTRLDGGAFTLQTQLAREIELRKVAEKDKAAVIQKLEEVQEQRSNLPQPKEQNTEQLAEIEKKMAAEKEKFATREAELQSLLREKTSQASQAAGKSETVKDPPYCLSLFFVFPDLMLAILMFS